MGTLPCRMALFGDAKSSSELTDKQLKLQRAASTASTRSLDKTASTVSEKSTEEKKEENEDNEEDEEGLPKLPRPFQRLDFLVRDWQDFSRTQTLDEKREDMEQYMVELLASRKQKDLADTREQISSCFEKVACFLLPHPGHAVTEREYDGSVEAIDNRFLELLTAYLDDLFDPAHLFPKKIHGVTVTSRELFTYIKTYAGLFREASIFPEAKTLLEATAEANNVNQRDKALLRYKREMDKVAGSKCQYVPVQELDAHHKACLQGAMDVFDEGARMGRRSEILRYRQEVADQIEKERQRYLEVNAERDPYKNLEFYLIPGCLALALLVFRISQDLLCYDSIGYDIPLYDCKYVSLLAVESCSCAGLVRPSAHAVLSFAPVAAQASEPHAVPPVLGPDRVHAADHDVHRPSHVQAREDGGQHRQVRDRRGQGGRQGEEGLGCVAEGGNWLAGSEVLTQRRLACVVFIDLLAHTVSLGQADVQLRAAAELIPSCIAGRAEEWVGSCTPGSTVLITSSVTQLQPKQSILMKKLQRGARRVCLASSIIREGQILKKKHYKST
jgi:hypothetical protein